MKDAYERIIAVTTELIETYQGDLNSITARDIAAQANVGLGLINYHFKSKAALIALCVQRIIEQVILEVDFKQVYSNDRERLTAWAQHVFTFLFEHPAIARVSILSDMEDYQATSNSIKTQFGFSTAFKTSVNKQQNLHKALTLTSTMQVAFLMPRSTQQLYGYDFTKENDRNRFIQETVNLLFNE